VAPGNSYTHGFKPKPAPDSLIVAVKQQGCYGNKPATNDRSCTI